MGTKISTISRRTLLVVAVVQSLIAAIPVAAGLAPVAAEAAEATDVVVPNFWDPRRRVERPAAGTVESIRFITTDDFPPFNFLDAEGHLTGFNVDLARAICAELAIRCTIQARPWDNLIETLTARTADAAIAGIAVSAESRVRLDFSDVYMRQPGRFVVRKDAAPLELSPEGLKGKTLAVVARTAHEAYLAAFFPEVARKLFDTADQARAALKAGEVDAHFGDGEQLSFWLASDAAEGCCAFTGGPYLESRFFGSGMAIAMPHGSPDLKRAIDSALESLYDKGVYAELYLRYFPVGFY
jgi:polar amino acid transport system substrate-binding protein